MRRLIGALLLALLLPVQGWAAVAVQNPYSNSASFADTLNVNTTVASGSNLALVCAISWNQGTVRTVSSVTFNGDALTRFNGHTATGEPAVDYWYRVSPDVTTANVVITMSGAVDFTLGAGCVVFTGVDQSTPLSGFQSVHGIVNPDPQPTLSITSAVDDMVLDTLTTDGGSPAVGAGQTSQWAIGNHYGSTEPGAATVTMSYGSISNFTEYSYGAVNVEAAAAAPAAETFGFRLRLAQ